MRCRKVEKLLPLHAGRDLDERDARRVEEHLTRCLGCFRLLKDYESALDVIHRVAYEEVGQGEPRAGITDGLVESVLAAIQEDGPRAPSPRVLHLRDSLAARISAAAAALLIVLFGTSLLTMPRGDIHPDGGPGSLAPAGSVLTITDTTPIPGTGWSDERGTREPGAATRIPERRKTWFAGSRSRDF